MSTAYIFYGKAGSGKGTQAKLLREHLESLGKEVISVDQGNRFRGFVKESGYVQDLTRETINSGALMPAFMPIYLWSSTLVEQFTGNEDVIFDGVARVKTEAEVLNLALSYLKFDQVFVLHVHLTDATAMERMKSRAQLAGDDARADDQNEKSMKLRLDAYQKQVMPIIEYWQNDSGRTMVEINGEETVEGVFEQIKKVIG